MLFQLRFIWEELKIQLVGIMRACVLRAFEVMKTKFRGVAEHWQQTCRTVSLPAKNLFFFFTVNPLIFNNVIYDFWSLRHYYYCYRCYYTFLFLSTAHNSDKLNTILCRLSGCVPSWQGLTILGSYGLWQQENWNGGSKVMDARTSVRAGSHVFVSLGLEASAHYRGW